MRTNKYRYLQALKPQKSGHFIMSTNWPPTAGGGEGMIYVFKNMKIKLNNAKQCKYSKMQFK